MNRQKNDNRLLYQYAGMAFQMLAAIGFGVFAGIQADKWINTPVPIFLWVLPLLIVIAMIVKAVKDTSKK